MTTEPPMPKGFNCTTCGTFHKFGGYVAAHWDLSLTHTCECGAEHVVRRGVVRLVTKGKNSRTAKDQA